MNHNELSERIDYELDIIVPVLGMDFYKQLCGSKSDQSDHWISIEQEQLPLRKIGIPSTKSSSSPTLLSFDNNTRYCMGCMFFSTPKKPVDHTKQAESTVKYNERTALN